MAINDKLLQILARAASSGLANDFDFDTWFGASPKAYGNFFRRAGNFLTPGQPFGVPQAPLSGQYSTQEGVAPPQPPLANLFDIANIPWLGETVPNYQVPKNPAGGKPAHSIPTRVVGDRYGGGFGPGAGRGGVSRFDMRSLFGGGGSNLGFGGEFLF